MTLEAEFAERTPFLRSLARRLVTDPAVADDLVQETCIAAMTAGPRRARALVPWLVAVLRKRAARRFRTDGRRRSREQATARQPISPATVDVAIKLDVARRLLQHVEALDTPGRDAVFLRYYENLKPQQIADRLGVPLATVKTRLARARARLRERLDADHPEGREHWLPAMCAIGGIAASPRGASAGNTVLAKPVPLLRHVLVTAGVLLTTIVTFDALLPRTGPALATRASTADRDASLEPPADAQLRREAVAVASPVTMVQGLVEDAGIGTEPGHGRPAADVAVRCELRLAPAPAPPSGGHPSASRHRLIEVETTTDARGRFQQQLPANAVLVAAKALGNETLRAACWNNPQHSNAPPGVPERLVLTRFPNGELLGLVTEPSAAPVADARVTLTQWQDGARTVVATTTSAADGSFVHRPRGTDLSLTAEREGCVQVSASQPRQLPRGGWEPARILLAPAGTITIEVVDPTGEPALQEQTVAVLLGATEQGLLEATQCSDGQYFRRVVPLVRGRATLTVPAGLQLTVFAGSTPFDREQDGQCLPLASGSGTGRAIVVGAGKELLLRIVLGNLVVRVLDPDGKSVPGAELEFRTPRDGRLEPLRLATSDAHGQFELDLGAAGNQWVLCTATGSGANAGLGAQSWLRLDATAPALAELRLQPATPLVGQVRDANRAAVAARVRRTITLPGDDEAIATGEWQTDDCGAFSMPNLAGVVQRLEILSDDFATVARDDVHPTAPIEVVLEQPKRARLRLLAQATAPAITELVVRVDYLEAKDGLAPAWPALGAATVLSPAARQAPAPLQDLGQRNRPAEAIWRSEEYRHVSPIDGPTGRAFEVRLDSGPAAISVCGSGADGETLSLVATGPVTIPGGEVELPLALAPTTTCRGRIVFAAGAPTFAACVALVDDSGRLLMLSRSQGAAWQTTQTVSSNGFFAMAEVPIGTWELRVGTRAELERGEARQRRRVVIRGAADEPIVVPM